MSTRSAEAKHAEARSNDDEDLFGDVEIAEVSPQIGASMRAELEAATQSVDFTSVHVAGTTSTAFVETPSSSAATPAAEPAEPDPAAPLATLASTYTAAKLGYTELAAWLLGAIALVNVGIGIGSLASPKHETPRSTSADATEAATAALLAGTSPALDEHARQSPPSDAKPEGYRTLELARARLERGEWQRARTMLYSQLAVVDAISEPARSDVEARAEFLIAESYRLQAAALAGPSKERRE